MDLVEIMQQQVFVIVGDTVNEEKYAYKIKRDMLEKDYTVYGVGKELSSINDINEEIDIIDLCTNAEKGLQIIKNKKKSFKYIVIQPGAEGENLISYLEENNMPYVKSCLLVGLKLFGK